ncbi:MAG: DUF721 domain-containing protein [Chloroflexi bacterium]|nr:DUF721 domain-containing protein [Chloroflexota bacterium]
MSRAVDRLLRGLGIATEVDRASALDRWAEVAREVLGDDAVVTRAVGLDGATLVVAVPTSAWAAEIRLRQTALLERLRSAAPKSDIRSIRTTPTAH